MANFDIARKIMANKIMVSEVIRKTLGYYAPV